MTDHFMRFFHMGGYAFYVWGAYISMLFLLGLPWILSLCRLKSHTSLHANMQNSVQNNIVS